MFALCLPATIRVCIASSCICICWTTVAIPSNVAIVFLRFASIGGSIDTDVLRYHKNPKLTELLWRSLFRPAAESTPVALSLPAGAQEVGSELIVELPSQEEVGTTISGQGRKLQES